MKRRIIGHADPLIRRFMAARRPIVPRFMAARRLILRASWRPWRVIPRFVAAGPRHSPA